MPYSEIVVDSLTSIPLRDMTDIEQVDVLIVGAGPAGLMAANALTDLGVRIKVVEKRAYGETAGQADGTQPGMIEVWQSYGLADDLLRDGSQCHSLVSYSPNADGTGVDRTSQNANISAKTARYPFEVLLPVTEIEEIIRKALKKKGTTISQSTVPTKLDFLSDLTESSAETSYPIRVTLKNVASKDNGHAPSSDGKIVDAKYVLACDGAHSWVRKTVGIPVEGDLEEHKVLWAVLDFTPDSDCPDIRCKCIIQSPLVGSVGYIGRPGGTARIYVPLGQAEYSDMEKLKEEIITTVGKAFLPYRMRVTKITWFGTYTVAQRVAAQFCHRDRVFLAGDACHTHSPKAGQGANAAMFDVHNLSWKLAYVLRGWAKPSLLNTYDEERRKFAVDLIDFDKEMFKLWGLEPAEPGVYESLWNKQNAFISGIGIGYDSVLIVRGNEHLAHKLPIGERFPPAQIVCHSDWRPYNTQDLAISNGHFKLLIFAGKTADKSHADRLSAFAAELDKGLVNNTKAMVDIFTVTKNDRKDVLWDAVPESLRHWPDVYVDDLTSGGAYTEFGIGDAAAVLVRPDGHISSISPLDGGASKITSFLAAL